MNRGPGALLRDDGAFRRLTGARVVSFVGDSLSLVALMLHVAATTGDALSVAALLLVGQVVPALVSPLTGVVGDRFDRRSVMVVCELLQATVLVVIALALPALSARSALPLLLALVAVRAVAGQVLQPAARAAVPALVADRDLATANATLGFGTNGAEALGPLLAAGLLPLVGVSGALLIDAVSFVASAALLSGLPALPPGAADGDMGGIVRGARAGLLHLWTHRPLRIITLGFCAVVAANGIDDVALVVLGRDDLRVGDSGTAVLLAAVGIGLLAGYALLAAGAHRASAAVLLVVGFGVSSIGNLLTGLAWALAVAFGLQAVRGLGIAAMDVASGCLLQRLVPGPMQGRVFGNLYGVIGAAAAVSYVGGGLLLDAAGAPATFVVAGTVGVLATVAVTVVLPAALH